jgi:Pathogenicity locus
VSGTVGFAAAPLKAIGSKASCTHDCKRLEQLPNIGPAAAADLRLIGITEPRQLRGEDALGLYQKLCRLTKQRHDPCVLDTFMAAVDFMNGAEAAAWWSYTAQRKAKYGAL